MIYGLYLSAAGAQMESARHSVIANNLANVNTVGFRGDLAVVMARDAEAREDASAAAYATPMDVLGGGALLSETCTSSVEGPLQHTGQPLDFAAAGEGYFAVTDGQQIYYTRAGAFARDTNGRLTTPDGRYFLTNASGTPIAIPLEGAVSVTKDGTVSVNGGAAAKIDLFKFSGPRAVEKIGANLYSTRGEKPTTEGTGQILQGELEMSSVSPAAELSKMILASRGYEMNMQFIRMHDQTLGDLVALGRVSM